MHIVHLLVTHRCALITAPPGAGTSGAPPAIWRSAIPRMLHPPQLRMHTFADPLP